MDGLRDYLALSHEQRLELLSSFQVQKAELAACEQVLLHAIGSDAPDVEIDSPHAPYEGRYRGGDKDWIDEEVGCVLRISSRTAGDRLLTARRLVTLLPDTLAALAVGDVGFGHALRLSDATLGLGEKVTALVQAAVLPKASRQTPGQFAAAIRKAVARFDTRTPDVRHEDARAERRVVFAPQPDGMCHLYAYLLADAAAAIRDQVYRCAAQAKGRGGTDDGRSADQRRADTLVDLFLDPTGSIGGAASAKPTRTVVNATVALSTLLAVDQHGGELAGHGPIPAASHTLDAGHCLDGGHYLDGGAHTYRPSADLERHIRMRDQTCRFPGCRRNSEDCELDHLLAWADGGLTTEANTHALCPRHHHLKHETTWRVQRWPDGSTRWISPTSHPYTQPPPDPLPVDTTMSLAIHDPPPY